MKKKLIAVLLSMCLVLSMAACGGAEETTTQDEVTEETTAQDEVTEDEAAEDEVAENEVAENEVAEDEVAEDETATEETSEESADSEAAFGSLEEYFATVDLQSMIDAAQAAAGDTVIVDIYAEGNDLVYDYAFAEGTLEESSLDLMGETLTAELKKQTAVFADIAAQMNQEVGIEDCRVIVYYTYNDEVIAEGIFAAGDVAPAAAPDAGETTQAAVEVDSLEAYFETEDGKLMVEDAKSSVGEGVAMDIFAEGNDLVYAYTYEDGTIDPSTIDAVSEQLVTEMENQATIFESIAAEMNALIGADDCRVAIRYYYEEELLAEGYFEVN